MRTQTLDPVAANSALASGTLRVTETGGADVALPTALVAVTEIEYVLPAAKPVNTHDVEVLEQ